MVSRELEKECIVVFDEAHNIDNVCIEARPPPGPGRAKAAYSTYSTLGGVCLPSSCLFLTGQSARTPAAQACASALLLCPCPHGTCSGLGSRCVRALGQFARQQACAGAQQGESDPMCAQGLLSTARWPRTQKRRLPSLRHVPCG